MASFAAAYARARRRAKVSGAKNRHMSEIPGMAVTGRREKPIRTRQTRKRVGDAVQRTGWADGRKVFEEMEKYTLASGVFSQFLAMDTARVAKEARKEVKRIFDTEGYRTWMPNKPSTEKWKGHDAILRGLVGNPAPLRDSVQVVSLGDGSIQATHFVRFPDTPHPYATWGDGSPMSFMELQALHELGWDEAKVKFPPRPVFALLDTQKRKFNAAAIAALRITSKRLNVPNPKAIRGDR